MTAGSDEPSVDTVADVAEVGSASGFTKYIAFGDSFSSGNGAGGDDSACHVTPGGWPAWVSGLVGIADYTNYACSGAVSTTVASTQIPSASLPNTDQNTLITITIGANDTKFPEWFGKCLAWDCSGDQAYVDGQVALAAQNVTALLINLRQSTHYASILAVGYPHMVAEGGAWYKGITAAEAVLIRYGVNQMNAAISAAVDSVNQQFAPADYAPMYAVIDPVTSAFATHELYTDVPYINGLDFTYKSYHPNLDGNVAYAKAVQGVVNGLSPFVPSQGPSAADAPVQTNSFLADPTAGAQPTPLDGTNGVSATAPNADIPGVDPLAAQPGSGAIQGSTSAQLDVQNNTSVATGSASLDDAAGVAAETASDDDGSLNYPTDTPSSTLPADAPVDVSQPTDPSETTVAPIDEPVEAEPV